MSLSIARQCSCSAAVDEREAEGGGEEDAAKRSPNHVVLVLIVRLRASVSAAVRYVELQRGRYDFRGVRDSL